MKQAILITAYKNFSHLDDLVTYFDTNFSIYIHIDKKSSISEEQIAALRSKENVAHVSQKYKINWGDINHLKSIIYLAQEALSNQENTYFHLITGHDYPIRKLDDFIAFGQENQYLDFMEYHTLPYEPWPEGGMDRLSRYNMYDFIDGRSGLGERLVKGFSKIQRKIGFRRSFDKNFPSLYGGSTYWSLSRKSLEYVFEYMEKYPSYLKRFKFSFCSEEIFFQTILLNSPRKEKITNDNLRFIVWEERNGNFPANLDSTDYESIKKTNALFARKFEFPYSQSLLDQIKMDVFVQPEFK